jgi:hypothetical protein
LVLFARLGPVEAGRFGLTLTALGAVATGATAWLSTKAPRFGGLVAQARYAELDTVCTGALRGALTFGALGLVVRLSIVFALDQLHAMLALRFVPLLRLCAMAGGTLITIRVNAHATYLGAFRREPYLTLLLVADAAQVAVAMLLSGLGSINAVAIGYAAIALSMGFFWALAVFDRLHHEHALR